MNDKELELLDKKVELYGANSRIDLLRHLIIYGAVFKVDLSGFNEFNTILARIDKQMSEITYEVKKSGNIHKDEVMELKKYLDEL